MGSNSKRASLAALIALAGAGAGAQASPITYGLLSGTPSEIVVTATYGSANAPVSFNGSADLILMLTSGDVTLDPGGPTLDSYVFKDSSAGPVAIGINGTTVGNLSLSGFSLSSGAAVGLSGTGPYSFQTTTAVDSGQYGFMATGSTKTQSGSFSESGQSFVGTITTGSAGSLDFSQTQGIQLGTFMLGSQSVTLKGDVNFDGETTVPLPAAGWLLAAGLGALGAARRRRASAARTQG